MAKGIWNRVKALWELSDEIEPETEESILERFRKPRVEFLEANVVKEILERKENATIDDALTHE